MKTPKAFIDRALDKKPTLHIRFEINSKKRPNVVRVNHQLGARPKADGKAFLASLQSYDALKEFRAFYNKYNGVELCRVYNPRHESAVPLIRFLPAEEIEAVTLRFMPGGDSSWAIDLNKTKPLYRGRDKWIVFAGNDEGPTLALFCTGRNAGAVFLISAQPHFNILKPIAKSFSILLARIAFDIAAFLRLCRVYVTRKGPRGLYGYIPLKYTANA